MILLFKGIPREFFLFDYDIKIANAKLKFIIEVATRKVKSSLVKNQFFIANLKSFSNRLSDSTSKLSSQKSSLLFCLCSST